MGDRIRLEGMQFYGYHGVLPEEQRLGQRFVVDVEVELDLRKAGHSDRLEHTVNYSEIYRAVQEVVEGPSRRLIEAVAEAIAERVCATCGTGHSGTVRVRVAKPCAPIRGSILSTVAVEIERPLTSA
jgi:dihydroneopterin aldolase